MRDQIQRQLGMKRLPTDEGLVTRLRTLADYDLTAITSDYHAKSGTSLPSCRSLAARARQYIALTLVDPANEHSPSLAVDEYWHRMILHTRWYAQFCDDVFGRFLHHQVSDDKASDADARKQKSIAARAYWFNQPAGVTALAAQCNNPAECNNQNCNTPAECNNENCNNPAECNNENCNNQGITHFLEVVPQKGS